MSSVAERWRILPHEPIQVLSEAVWRVEGTVPRMPLRRVMTLVRRSDGRIVVHNAIALEPEAMARIEQWGTPAFLVVPGAGHRMDASAFVRRYPEIQVYCPRGARGRIEKLVRVTGDYDSYPDDARCSLRHLHGTALREGVMVARDDAGETLVFNDLIFNMPHQPGVGGWLLKTLTKSSGGVRISSLSRMMLCRDRAKLRDELLALANPGLARIIVSHYEVIEDAPREALERVAHSLR